MFDHAGDVFHEQLFVGDLHMRMSLYYIQMARYAFFSRFVEGKRVLDFGCGSGNQCFYLKQMGAASVTGVDISPRAISYAREMYGGEGVQFLVADVTNAGLSGAAFDVVITSEVIEHLPVAKLHEYLKEVRRVLRPDGVILLSTPNKTMSTGGPTPFHEKEFTYPELESLLRPVFEGYHIQSYRLLRAEGHVFHCECSEPPPLQYLATAPMLGNSCVPVPAPMVPMAAFFVLVISKIPAARSHYVAFSRPSEQLLTDMAVEGLSNRYMEQPGVRLLPAAIAELLAVKQPEIGRQILEPLLAEIEACPALAAETVRFQLGCIHMAAGEYAAAKELFEHVVSEMQLPKAMRASAWLALAESCLATGDLARTESAVAALRSLADSPKFIYQCLIVRARLAAAHQRTAEAEELFREARAVNSSRIESYLHLASLYRQTGECGRALEEIDLLLRPQMYRHVPIVYVEKAIAHEAQGTTDAAEDAYRRALGLDPAHFEANRGLGRLLMSQNRPQQALPYLQRASALRPGQAALVLEVSWCHLKFCQLDPAIVLALKIEPATRNCKEICGSWFSLIQALAHALLHAKQYTQLVRLFAGLPPARRCESSNFDALMSALQALATDDALLALKLVALALESRPEDPVLQYAKGSILKRLGRGEEAGVVLRDLLFAGADRLLPASIAGGAHFHLGEILVASERIQEAKCEFAECLRVLPEHRKASERLAALESADGMQCHRYSSADFYEEESSVGLHGRQGGQ